jgi:adenosyl cobinamide kinase/adenosyl cobinamide phosphate guanylyltransferase
VSWAFLWLFLGIATTAVFLVFAVAVGRHAIIIGRTARRFRDEVGPIAQDVSREGSETADRAEGLRVPRRSRPS